MFPIDFKIDNINRIYELDPKKSEEILKKYVIELIKDVLENRLQ